MPRLPVSERSPAGLSLLGLSIFFQKQSERLVFIVCHMLCFIFFFFFQAEDGIRDLTVTGVQTCALPILLWLNWITSGRFRAPVSASVARTLACAAGTASMRCTPALNAESSPKPLRSEERRVGKEGRSRWAPDH